ncbi:hypothetical protein [Oscillibacter sp.]|uniref:hypothetical protein n=1 Tax=Oscillibacter sp. TaxID=1945593 RepID=UPI0028A1F1DC|nr:hypothetical protein [Oscillibacter sp.]
MLTRSEKAILAFILLFNLALWVLFGVAFICFHNTFSFSSGLVHVMTTLDWELAAQSAKMDGDTFGSILTLIGVVAAVINGLGLWMLWAPEYKRGTSLFLPISKQLLVAVPWSAFLIYAACYIWIKYFVDYFRVWMHLVPLMFQSAVLLTLLAIGFHGLRSQKQNHEWNL